MIYLEKVQQYCQEYWKIENYDLAMVDTTQTWHCHHRHEIDWALTMKELIAIGRYYDVHYSELIFLTPSEHSRLHNTGKEGYWKGKEGPNKGKISGENNPMYGVHRFGENNPNYKYHIPEEELYDLYVVQGLSTYKIAEIYGCCQTTIQYKLKKYNIIKNQK